MKKGFKFFYCVFAVLLTAHICSVFTKIGINEWYNNIELPSLTPPNIIFPIIWSVIYVLMIISVFIALRDADSQNRRKVNNLFILQLFLQIIWCFTFFTEGYLGLGLAIILLLDMTVFRMIAVYSKVNSIAGALLYPYYWWLIFASFLNFNFVYNFGLVIVY